MTSDEIKVVRDFPREVREIENIFISLKDGTKLATRIWLPVDAEQDPVPAILEYLPYRKRDGTAERDELTHPYYAGHGYACVRVDMRGAGESDGLLHDEYLQQEQDDALEILTWITQQPWCSGSTGMIGISWGGFNGLQIAARRPASLKAVVTLCSTDDRYADDIHYMGGVMLKDNLTWGATMFAFNARPPDPKILGDAWRNVWRSRLEANDPWILNWLEHQYRDEFWQHGSVCENFAAIECAVYAVGGWADGYSNAVPRLLAGLRSPAKGLIGPWAHKYPHFALPGPRIGFLQETLRWWDHWLKKQDTGIMDEPRYRVWMQSSIEPRTHYPTRPGRWVAEPTWPSDNIESVPMYFDTHALVAQPAAPATHTIATPLSLGARQGTWCSHGMNPDSPNDQREDDGCSLLFDSEPLEQDIEILGAPVVTLALASDQSNAFIVARLNDVAPDGASTRVTYGVLNLTHRISHENPEPLTPGKIYLVEVRLNDIAQCFPRGHRIRLALSNTMWPMFWPSPRRVALTLHTKDSQLSLPVRKQRASDTALPAFESPQSATPQVAETLEQPEYVRRIEKDETNGDSRVTVIDDTGLTHLPLLGWRHGSTSRHYFSINDDDPNSARAHVHWTTRHMDIRVETQSTLTSDENMFHIDASLDAYEGEEKFYSKTWRKSVKRQWN